MSHPLQKVIVALDYETADQARQLVDELGKLIHWYKVGTILFTRFGSEIIEFLHERNKKILLDLKLHDTPDVVARTVHQFGEMGVQLATVHCLGGKAMLEAAASSCRESRLRLIGVTLLTSQRATDYQDIGVDPSSRELIPALVDLALQARFAGVICSPHEITQIRRQSLPGFLLVVPGIRIPGQEVFQDDQQRVASPEDALCWGADYLVIGRPITQAREPRERVLHLFGPDFPTETSPTKHHSASHAGDKTHVGN